jgi:hypothetical protein
MAKNSFSVCVIRKGRENDYRDFWDRGVKVNSHREILTSELVGFTEIVVASTLIEAFAFVREKFPTLILAEDHSGMEQAV